MLDAAVGEEAVAEPAVRRRRARGWWWGVVGLVVLAVGALLWVLLPGAVALEQSTVLLDARPFSCKQASDVTTASPGSADSSDERVYVPALRMHPGLDCTMSVLIRNDSDSDIAVDRVVIPMAGPSNGWGVHADHAFTQGVDASGGEDALDAVFDYQHDPDAGSSYPVRAHQVKRIRIHLSWAGGCMDNGSAATFTDAPTAVLSAGIWHVQKSWNGAGYALLGSKNSLATNCNR